MQNWVLDMSSIIKKAQVGGSNNRGGAAGSISTINISHLNPAKGSKSQKNAFEFKKKMAQTKLAELQNLVSKNLKLIDYEPVPFDSLTEEHIA